MNNNLVFVMINTQRGDKIMPLVDENDEVILFDYLYEAHETAKENPAASSFGYEVFELGTGD